MLAIFLGFNLQLALAIPANNPASTITPWETAYLSHMPHFALPNMELEPACDNPADNPSKYKPSFFPDSSSGTFFSGVFSDHAVLQRGPQQSAVYGVVLGAEPLTQVAVTVEEVHHGSKYTVAAKVEVTNVQTKAGRYARWKALLKVANAGGNYRITVSCTKCDNTTTAVINDVTFGDVWFCSGQSNMWLPMHMDTSRNVTYQAVLNGKYKNIRMNTQNHNNQPDGGYKGTDLGIAPPAPPRNAWGGYAGGAWLLADVGTYANATCREGGGDHGCPDPTHCCTGYPEPNDDWLYNSIDQFSAACWHFAEHLTDIAEKKGEPVIPLGIIGSHWGGTMVEHWIPNATLNAQVCKNNSGGAYAPWQNGRWDIDSGALFNGMVEPWLNFTIRGALWYQGENNVFQCHDANETSRGNRGLSGGPYACGDAAKGTGYACMMEALIVAWRKAWSVEAGTTPPDFPFGLVTLAGGTSEGFPHNMGAFRWAQTGNAGTMPSKRVPNTFSAMAYDTGDPCEGGGQCCVNSKDGQGGWPCESGEAPYTGQFMGGIHPRVKKIVGKRLAKAARAFAHGDKDIVWTGPVLIGCSLQSNAITLQFDKEKLKDDTIMVLNQAVESLPLADANGRAWDPSLLPLIVQLAPQSPMEIQINNDLWIPAKIDAKCSVPDHDNMQPCQGGCNWNCTTNTKTAGWDVVSVPIPDSISANITAIRYAWGGNPCCPTVNRQIIPCPPNSCPIQTFNTTMPAVPFWATIKAGKCVWMSTQN